MRRELSFKPIPMLIAILMVLFIWFIPHSNHVSEQGWHLLAIFVGVIIAIIGKAMPIGALSILAVMIVAVSGVTAQKPSEAMNNALSSYSNQLIWLIGIAVMISRGLLKTGLGARIGYLFIAAFGKKTLGIGYSLALSELLLAPVTPSNTARGGGIIHPIMKAIANSYGSNPENNSQHKMGKYLALVNYHANPISSAMFITATAPNPLIVNFIAELVGSNFRLSWSAWSIAMLLPGLVAFAVMPLVLYFIYPPEIKETPNAVQFAKTRLQEMGKMSLDEKIMLIIFAILLILWADLPAWIFGKNFSINATATAFIGLSLLLLSNVLTWDDILKEKNAWDTIIWFGALIMMATYLNKLGIVKWFSGSLESGITHLGLNGISAGILLILAYMYAHYLFASTTAHITAMFGAFLSAAISLGSPPMFTALMMASASNIMMSLTHYATGTSPVIFGSGYTTLGEWWKAGFIMSIVNFLIFGIIGGIWWKILGYW